MAREHSLRVERLFDCAADRCSLTSKAGKLVWFVEACPLMLLREFVDPMQVSLCVIYLI